MAPAVLSRLLTWMRVAAVPVLSGRREQLRLLLERLHRAGNPLGSVVLADEFKYRTLRFDGRLAKTAVARRCAVPQQRLVTFRTSFSPDV